MRCNFFQSFKKILYVHVGFTDTLNIWNFKVALNEHDSVFQDPKHMT